MRSSWRLLLLASLALTLPAPARVVEVDPAKTRSLPADGAVTVQWRDPARFAEPGDHRSATRPDNWVFELARYLRARAAPRIASGHRLEVTLLDIDRAGEYEPWVGVEYREVRVLRDVYPPRIALEFRELDTAGHVVASGARVLVDPAFLSAAGMPSDDPLRFEKRLLDRWIAREWPARQR